MVAFNTIFVHVLSHNPTHWIYPTHFGVVIHIKKIKELFVSFIFQHWLAMFQGVEQGGKLNKFPTFPPHYPINNYLQH
jgi:hypothetical protein